MKKYALLLSFVLFSVLINAQNKDVTKFLGIPVDGTKAEMISKLKAKGFKSSTYDREVLEGEFNGYDVSLHVVTNKNKVYRIMLEDINSLNETDIKYRFNNLCRQFRNNKKYSDRSLSEDNYLIPDNEDVSYNIAVANKRYQAVFYQKTEEELDVISLKDNPSEEILSDIIRDGWSATSYEPSNKVVWFMISKDFGRYRITMFYDNEYNRANGEDL